ncbi:MAG: SRPBCC family protein [bacterium]|nr:SRPBCC family protein [bacterium]
MRKAVFETTIDQPVDAVWSVITRVEDYPSYIRHVYKVEWSESLEVGSEWFDWSTIIFVPLRLKHVVVKMEPNKELVFFMPLPFGGKMNQLFTISQNGSGTKIRVEINFDLKQPILNQIVGPILTRRLFIMMISTLDNFKRKQNDS